VPLDRDLEAVGVLVEPQRLRVYEHLLAAAAPPSLSDLGAALGVSRTLLAFHLTKLVEAGFVEVLAPDPQERRRGRPSQRYRATTFEVTATVPARRYDLIAEILLEAARSADVGVEEAARQIARRRGTELAAAEPGRGRAGTSRTRMARVERLLTTLGYSPRVDDNELVAANCPFDRLRATNIDLVCSINQALTEGYLQGLGLNAELTAQLRPCPDQCCVVVSPA
jgi:predicted ArsR family transcriptional regulator